jgi:hypothetical protein
VGHYSNECPKRLAKLAGNTAAPAQNQRRFAARKNPNNNGRYYNMTATEAQKAPQNMPSMFPAKSYRPISLRNLTFLKISGRDLFKGEGFVTPQISKQRENEFPFSKNENQQKLFLNRVLCLVLIPITCVFAMMSVIMLM